MEPSEKLWISEVIPNQKPNVHYSELFMFFPEQTVAGTTK